MAVFLIGGGVCLGTFLVHRFYQQGGKEGARQMQLIPIVKYGSQGVVTHVETFGDYVVRQLGLLPELNVSISLTHIAEDYLRGEDGCHQRLMDLIMNDDISAADAEDIAEDLIHELDCCILLYFSYHWHHSGIILDQIKTGVQKKRTFRKFVRDITRAKYIERVVKVLCPAEKIVTLLEQLRAVSIKLSPGAPTPGQVMVPADRSQRSPVLLMVGGGMGAGKSTVVKEILSRGFWAQEAKNAVIVEADAFKEKSLIYRTLKDEEGVDLSDLSQMVHESSTKAASSTLVAALNEGRDIIFDGTMSWEPFVVQTVEMVRRCHEQKYRLGPGYKRYPNGKVVEQYWEPRDDDDEEVVTRWEEEGDTGAVDLQTVVGRSSDGDENQQQNANEVANQKNDISNGIGRIESIRPRPAIKNPYRIEFVGVTCDAALAVARGMRRAILTGRGVPVQSQLRSHCLFANSFEKYCSIVDQAALYCTSDPRSVPQLIAWKDQNSHILTDAGLYMDFEKLRMLNEKAGSISELYTQSKSHGGSTKLPLSNSADRLHNPTRQERQKRVASAVVKAGSTISKS